MKAFYCPRCREPFERNESFCKNCGIRKGRPFSKWRWWLIALLIDLLLVGIFAGIREKMITANGYPMDLSNGMLWLLFGVVFMLNLVPIVCIYGFYFFLLLRRRGLITKGTVVDNYIEVVETDGGKENRRMSGVTFTPDVADPPQCRVTRRGWFTIGSTVDVVYDPYNPRDYAQVGTRPSLVMPIVMIILGLFTAAMAIFTLVMVLMTPPL